MGKNSLIKSTSKKKTAKKKKDEDTKKTAVKKKATAKSKAASKAKAAKKPAAAMKTTAGPPEKKLSRKALIFKKFAAAPPEKLFAVRRDRHAQPFTAPPFVSGKSDEETKRIRALLFKSFSMADITAAAEKTAAEKAAAEKAAAEKAAAEKAAAEKAAAEKQAEAPPVSVTYDEPKARGKKLDSVEKSMVIFAAGIAFLFLLIIGASISNKGNFYLEEKDGAIEVHRGRFSPLGKEFMIALPGVEMPETTKAVYTKKDVFPLIFNHYIDKADTLLQTTGMPDFDGIRDYLNQASAYAVTKDLRNKAELRLNNIDRLILMYKAEVAINRDTVEDLKAALDHLANAKRLTGDTAQKDLIEAKAEAVKERLAALEAEAEAAEAAAEANEAADTVESGEVTVPPAETAH